MDKIIKALGISLVIMQIINIIYVVMFIGNVLNNRVQQGSGTVYYVYGYEIMDFFFFEIMMMIMSITLSSLLMELEVKFVTTLKRIIRMDEIEEDEEY